MKIPILEFNREVHLFDGWYWSKKGTYLGSPYDIETCEGLGPEDLQKMLRKNPKAKAIFLIYDRGQFGGSGSRQYRLSNILLDIKKKILVTIPEDKQKF